MPKIYRAMKGATDNLPVVEPSARSLGVRVPPSPRADVDIDSNGCVIRNQKGMSVAKQWRDLPRHRIPERLDDGELGAIGPNSDRCWKMGTGLFQPGEVSADLDLVIKSHDPAKGNVVPNQTIPLAQFQAALAATRDQWVVDEA